MDDLPAHFMILAGVRAVTSLGRLGRRRVFWGRPKFLHYVQRFKL